MTSTHCLAVSLPGPYAYYVGSQLCTIHTPQAYCPVTMCNAAKCDTGGKKRWFVLLSSTNTTNKAWHTNRLPSCGVNRLTYFVYGAPLCRTVGILLCKCLLVTLCTACQQTKPATGLAHRSLHRPTSGLLHSQPAWTCRSMPLQLLLLHVMHLLAAKQTL